MYMVLGQLVVRSHSYNQEGTVLVMVVTVKVTTMMFNLVMLGVVLILLVVLHTGGLTGGNAMILMFVQYVLMVYSNMYYEVY
jgi:hypothetical protein